MTMLQPLFTALQLGQTLVAARKARKWSQRALADRLGLSQSRVSRLELHANELSVQQLLDWCALLDLEISIGVREYSADNNSSAW